MHVEVTGFTPYSKKLKNRNGSPVCTESDKNVRFTNCGFPQEKHFYFLKEIVGRGLQTE